MNKRPLPKFLLPILGGSIAIGYGGSIAAFSLIAAWPVAASGNLASTPAVWWTDLILGTLLLILGFGTLLASSRPRRYLQYALIVAGVYELARATLLSATPVVLSDYTSAIFVAAGLFVGGWIVGRPSSRLYTNDSNS